MLCHNTGTASQHRPGKQGTEERIPQSRPGSGDSVFPAKLPRITHEDHRREIACPIGKSGQPRPHTPAAQHKSIHIGGMFPAVKSDADHDTEKDDEHH